MSQKINNSRHATIAHTQTYIRTTFCHHSSLSWGVAHSRAVTKFLPSLKCACVRVFAPSCVLGSHWVNTRFSSVVWPLYHQHASRRDKRWCNTFANRLLKTESLTCRKSKQSNSKVIASKFGWQSWFLFGNLPLVHSGQTETMMTTTTTKTRNRFPSVLVLLVWWHIAPPLCGVCGAHSLGFGLKAEARKTFKMAAVYLCL